MEVHTPFQSRPCFGSQHLKTGLAPCQSCSLQVRSIFLCFGLSETRDFSRPVREATAYSGPGSCHRRLFHTSHGTFSTAVIASQELDKKEMLSSEVTRAASWPASQSLTGLEHRHSKSWSALPTVTSSSAVSQNAEPLAYPRKSNFQSRPFSKSNTTHDHPKRPH